MKHFIDFISSLSLFGSTAQAHVINLFTCLQQIKSCKDFLFEGETVLTDLHVSMPLHLFTVVNRKQQSLVGKTTQNVPPLIENTDKMQSKCK